MKNKIINTLKMMGVSGMKAVFFADALQLFPLTINKEVRQGMIDTILNTKVMDKTFREWFEHFVKEGNKRGVVYEFTDIYNQPQSCPYTMKDFDFARIEKPSIMVLIEMVLQEYYTKEKVMV